MKKLAALALLALAVAGCTFDQFQQDAAVIIGKIKAGAAVAAVEVDNAVNFVCTQGLPAANTTLMTIRGTFPNPGPKTAKAIRDANNAIVGAAMACDAYAATPSTSGKLSIAVKLWNGYNAGKAAATAANAAAGQ